MAHESKITVAALAALLALGAGSMQVSAADEQSAEEPAVAATAVETGAATESEPQVSEEAEITAGWLSRNGKQYYMQPDGSYAVGETVIDGVPYLFGFSGALKTDWQTVDGKRYYYDPATGEPVFGWIAYFDNLYYVTEEDGKLTGFQEIDDARYAFSEDGVLYTGEFYVDEIRYYAAPETGVLEEGLIASGDEAVVTDEEGVVVSGWYTLEDGRTYYNNPETGLAELGVVCVDGEYYCITPDSGMVKGFVLLEDEMYPFDAETGILADGWYVYGDMQYYFDRKTMCTLTETLAEIDGNTYYFDASGAVATGWIYVDGELFWFGVDGVRYANGVLELDGETYLFDENGSLCYGWQEIAGLEYYFLEDGTMAVSQTIVVGDFSYTFDENGLLTEAVRLQTTLDVVSYKQWDEEWTSVKLGTSASSTIGKAGCLVTSMAMLHSYTTGEEYKPVDIKDMLKFTSGGALTSWDLISDMGYTVETYSTRVTEAILMKIYVQLQAGCPVVLGSKQASGGQHYVIVTGYIGDGTSFAAKDFTINDPGYSTRFYLSDHLAIFYNLYKLIY